MEENIILKLQKSIENLQGKQFTCSFKTLKVIQEPRLDISTKWVWH